MKLVAFVVAFLTLVVGALQLAHDVFGVGISPGQLTGLQPPDDQGGGGTATPENEVPELPEVEIPSADTEPPTAPTDLQVQRNGCDVTLSWTASDDNVGVSNYRIFEDGSFAGMVDGGSTTFGTFTFPGSDHSFTVQAVDGRHNESPHSGAASVPAC
jgi:hypothetical protein